MRANSLIIKILGLAYGMQPFSRSWPQMVVASWRSDGREGLRPFGGCENSAGL